jgi:hypothetical protein
MTTDKIFEDYKVRGCLKSCNETGCSRLRWKSKIIHSLCGMADAIK